MNRVQIPRLKHDPSGQLVDGTSEWRGPTAGVIIFPALSRSRKRSSGLKSKHRRGCRSVAAHPKHSAALRPHNRSPTDIDSAHASILLLGIPGATGAIHIGTAITTTGTTNSTDLVPSHVWTLAVSCWLCHHEPVLSTDHWPTVRRCRDSAPAWCAAKNSAASLARMAS
jgi:hypothetical protein